VPVISFVKCSCIFNAFAVHLDGHVLPVEYVYLKWSICINKWVSGKTSEIYISDWL